MVENAQCTVPAVILAGGRSRRLGGGDKCLLSLAGRPILAHVIERIRPQVTELALNANGDPARFAGFGLEIVADDAADYAGPLAGILAGFEWAARRQPNATHLLTVPSDAPFLPLDLVDRLGAAVAGSAAPALAASGGRVHPVIGLWPCTLREALHQALRVQGLRKVEDWTGGLAPRVVDFAVDPVDPFLNVNRPEDLATAERLCARAPKAIQPSGGG